MSLKLKIFLGVGISILIIFSVFAFYNTTKTEDIIMQKELETLNIITQGIETMMMKQLETSEVSALSMSNNTEVQYLFANREREKLADMLVPAFQSIKDRITQI